MKDGIILYSNWHVQIVSVLIWKISKIRKVCQFNQILAIFDNLVEIYCKNRNIYSMVFMGTTKTTEIKTKFWSFIDQDMRKINDKFICQCVKNKYVESWRNYFTLRQFCKNYSASALCSLRVLLPPAKCNRVYQYAKSVKTHFLHSMEKKTEVLTRSWHFKVMLLISYLASLMTLNVYFSI